jgi:hypothetical protein
MKTCDSLRIFKITVTNGSLILSFFSKNWNWQFFDSAIFKKLENAVLQIFKELPNTVNNLTI